MKLKRCLPAIEAIEKAISNNRDMAFELEAANPHGHWREWQVIRKAFPHWKGGVVKMSCPAGQTFVQVFVNASKAIPLQNVSGVGFSRKLAPPSSSNEFEYSPLVEPTFAGETMTANISIEAAVNEVEAWVTNDVRSARICMYEWSDQVLLTRICRNTFNRLVPNGWTEKLLEGVKYYRRVT